MARSAVKRESSMETLLETVGEHIDEGAEGMSKKELDQSEKRFNDALDRALPLVNHGVKLPDRFF